MRRFFSCIERLFTLATGFLFPSLALPFFIGALTFPDKRCMFQRDLPRLRAGWLQLTRSCRLNADTDGDRSRNWHGLQWPNVRKGNSYTLARSALRSPNEGCRPCASTQLPYDIAECDCGGLACVSKSFISDFARCRIIGRRLWKRASSASILAPYTKPSQSTWDGHYSWRKQRTGSPARRSMGSHSLPKPAMAR